jgi:hypothetical protein
MVPEKELSIRELIWTSAKAMPIRRNVITRES